MCGVVLYLISMVSPPPLVSISFGARHTAALTQSGEVYTWGNNEFGQLGYSLTPPTASSSSASTPAAAAANTSQHPPQQTPSTSASAAVPALPLTPALKTPVAGAEAGSATQRVSRRASGAWLLASTRNQLNVSTCQYTPRKVTALPSTSTHHTHIALSVCCGERHTSALLLSGCVYSWGSGETHQLGTLTNEDSFIPTAADTLGRSPTSDEATRAISLAVGMSMSAAVTATGDVYMWGYALEQACPTLIPGLRGHHMVAVAVGADENVVCLSGVANEVYAWQFEDEGDIKAEPVPKVSRSFVCWLVGCVSICVFGFSFLQFFFSFFFFSFFVMITLKSFPHNHFSVAVVLWCCGGWCGVGCSWIVTCAVSG